METEQLMKILTQQQRQKRPAQFSRGGEYLPLEVPPDLQYLTENNQSYLDLGFNKFMRREKPMQVAQALEATNIVDLIERGSIGSDKLGEISTDKIVEAINSLVKIADSASLSTTIPAGNRATLTSTLTDNQDPNRILLAVFHVTAYQGSIAAANAIPNGSSVTASDYDIYYSHDWGTNNNRYSSGIHFVRNTTAGDKTVLWDLHWRFIGGTAS